MDMIAGWPSEKGAEKIVMAIVISTLYGYFDYSLDILSRPECKQYLDDSRIDVLRDVIMKRSRSIAWKGMGAKYLSGLGRLLHRAFEGKQEDWARVGERFGNRKRFGMFG
ncbi:MAG: hypothetical protein HW380_3773 [Magnetococcales bacterium]|nr:hypothetical protein [Magnetococcales bacterium]HIJ84070.1 hypothetical protein [Magnetococcales bacterium]